MLDLHAREGFYPPVAIFGTAIFISTENDEIYLCRSCNDIFLQLAANLLISKRSVGMNVHPACSLVMALQSAEESPPS